MKIKIESEKIVKAVRKVEGIEIVLENKEDAKEGLHLVLRRNDLFGAADLGSIKDIEVTSLQQYETSAVDYKMIFLLEFQFGEEVPLDTKVGVIKALQDFFHKI
jgi:hypothetical protein